jgi:gliding-associated putative ABC transporter substrate-binding component GldG
MKPTQPFTDRQKLKLDQYVMNGGKIVWMIDRLYAEMDSLMRKQGDFIAYDRNLNIEDLLFKYGVRINPDLVQDLVCDKIPLVVGSIGDKPQMELVDWPYFPLLSSASDHSITKGLNQVLSIFPNSIDTIKVPNITKTILLQTSANSRKLVTPAMVSLNSVKTEDDLKTFDKAHIPIAVLLEGKFSSLYSNRLPKSTIDSFTDVYQQPFLSSALVPGKMIVVADADIATNVYAPQGEADLEMGYNKFTQAQYANKDFILNCIEYLTNSSGILATRSKEYTLRLLDAKKIDSDKTFWQLINIGLPIILVLLFGFLFQALRRRKYQKVSGE